eukprot:COSAG01_NODE_80381_length_120_cov_238.380952_1_plen_30_part_10
MVESKESSYKIMIIYQNGRGGVAGLMRELF